MASVEAPYSIHQRFGRYYLDRLNTLAAKLTTKNDTSYMEAITLLDEDFGQIRQAIGWLNTLASEDSDLSLIALNFLKVNIRLLKLRLTNDELVTCIQTALEAARQFQDEAMVRQCLYQLASIYSDIGRYDDGLAYSQELLVSSQKSADIRNEAKALGLIGTIDFYQGRLADARQKLEKCLALLKEIGDRSDVYGIFIGDLASTYSAERKHEIAIPLAQEALDLFREQRDLYRLGRALNNLGDDYVGLGRYSEALTAYEEGIQITRSIGHNGSLGFLLGNTGYIHLKLGHLDTARTFLEESITLLRSQDNHIAQFAFSAILFHINMTVENLSESNSELCGLIAWASERNIVSLVLLLLTVVARYYLLAGDPVHSLQLLDFLSTRPELEHECVYLIERVRGQVADVYPDLQSTVPLEQPLDDIVANILFVTDPDKPAILASKVNQ